MKKKFENRKTISVRLDEAEYKWVELQAGGNVSDWCREQILAEHPAGAQPNPETPEVAAAEVRMPKKEPVKQKCRHGLFYCATCLELARAES